MWLPPSASITLDAAVRDVGSNDPRVRAAAADALGDVTGEEERRRAVPALLPLLDEPVPELGLPRGTYGRVRARFLNALRGTEFAALDLVDEETRAASPLTALIAEDRAAIWRYGRGRGPARSRSKAATAASSGWRSTTTGTCGGR